MSKDKDDRAVDPHTGTKTTGHDWDGITELDTPLPRWWLWTFYATIVWGLLYTVAYPAWPMLSGATSGLLGYSSRGALEQDIARQKAAQAGIEAEIVKAGFGEIAADANLASYAYAGGAAVFRANCSQCHGAGAAGSKGYPNLRDDDWLWGGTPEDIYLTIAHGIRWEADYDTRWSEMPAFGDDGILEETEIALVADHVLSLSGKSGRSEAGATLYLDNCSGCHGEAGEGMAEMGAPALNDAIWLYGSDRASLIETITHSRFGVMPSWNTRLSEADLRKVAHYVHSLGGGVRE
ncbi:MAG: cytochrome-c oxidase, cbb3-type subunit III [Pseudomonadota bacterium]